MYVNLDTNTLVLILRGSPELMNLLPGWLTSEKPYYEQQPPYAYIESAMLPPNDIFARYVITLTVVLGVDGTDKEFRAAISAMDNAVLAPVDWCLPIKEVGDCLIVGVSKGRSSVRFRHTEKWDLTLSQDYYFDTTTVK